MKLFFIAAFFLSLSLPLYAQNAAAPNESLQQILTYYYGVKNALVKDDADGASQNAEKLLRVVKSIDATTLSGPEQKAFASAKEKLIYNADHISEVTDLDHQREHFAALSQAMSTLAQSASLSLKPIYIDYCPMKKSYWLSDEKDIKNPYYGKQMVTCGNVEKTIKPGEHSMQINDKVSANNAVAMGTIQMYNELQPNSATNVVPSLPENLSRPFGRAGIAFGKPMATEELEVNLAMNDTTPNDHTHHDMSSMHMSDTTPNDHIHHNMNNMQMTDSGMNMAHSHNMEDMNMPMVKMSHSFSLNLPMSRNGSGTGWSPDAAPMYGTMYHSKNWMYMLHYNLFIRYNKQDLTNKGTRGDAMVDAPNWLMFMGQRKVGEHGLFRFGTMFSIDAVITGQRGYPLLFQSGETAHGEPLVDRQHPHDLFSELSVAYSHAFSKKADLFAYFGYPGEPALGPVAFMHRASALYNPDAPISHHWIDATHITFGVATLGVRVGDLKLEGSSFTGREPDENRYDLDKPRFDSWSGRLSFNPSKNWALQVSHGYIKSPEALHPDENIYRTTASAEYSLSLQNDRELNATAIWGMNKQKDRDGEDAALLEASYRLRKLALFGKYEYVEKSSEELALDETIYGDALFPVHAFTLGLNYDLLQFNKTKMAIGSHFTLYNEDKRLYDLYGKNPSAFEVYIRIYPALMKM